LGLFAKDISKRRSGRFRSSWSRRHCAVRTRKYVLSAGYATFSIPFRGSVFAIGDLEPTWMDWKTEFNRCFDVQRGTPPRAPYPVPGVHDLIVQKTVWIFQLFGPASGRSYEGYYSSTPAHGHVVLLNRSARGAATNLPGGCTATSARGANGFKQICDQPGRSAQ